MAFPLVPFLAGAVVGGLSIYFYKDERARKDLQKRAGVVSGKAKEAAGDVSHKVSEGIGALREKVSRKGSATEVSLSSDKKTTTKKRATKKTARKKTAKAKSNAKKASAPTTETGD